MQEIAELKEQLSIANERTKNALEERDKMAEKLEEFRSDEPDPQKLAETLKNVDMDEV